MRKWKGTLGVLGLLAVLGWFGIARTGEKGSLSGLGKINTPVVVPTPTPRLLKIASMSDIHNDTASLGKALVKVKESGVDLVIIDGDLTMVGKKSELVAVKRVLDASGVKYIAIPGNHDLWTGRQINQDIWGAVFGADYQVVNEGNIRLILINNGDWRGIEGYDSSKIKNQRSEIGTDGLEVSPSFVPNGSGLRKGKQVSEGENQWGWIEKQVGDCPKLVCVVFAHMPLNHPKSAHIMGEDSADTASQAAVLINTFVQNKVQRLVAGHLHFYSNYELSGLKTTIDGAITSERNWQTPRFALITISSDGKVAVEEMVVE